jgi:transcriptional regulator with XRE-family HTH domain
MREREGRIRELYAEIGRRIRRARLDRELSQTELARSIGLSRVSLVNIEQGKQRAPVHVLYEIAESLEVRPHDVLPPLAVAAGSWEGLEKMPKDLREYSAQLMGLNTVEEGDGTRRSGESSPVTAARRRGRAGNPR